MKKQVFAIIVLTVSVGGLSYVINRYFKKDKNE